MSDKKKVDKLLEDTNRQLKYAQNAGNNANATYNGTFKNPGAAADLRERFTQMQATALDAVNQLNRELAEKNKGK